MEKTHFGDAEKGILCRGGLTTGKAMALDWKAVTCTKCQEYKLPASAMNAADVAAWLTERIPGNEKMRARQAEHQVEWAARQERWAVTETMTLHAIQHDIMVERPDDWVTIVPVSKKDAVYGVTNELKVQSRSRRTMIRVTVNSPYHTKDEITCKMDWDGQTVTDVWSDRDGTTHENVRPLIEGHVPYEHVAGFWKLGPVAALERYRAERLADEEDYED